MPFSKLQQFVNCRILRDGQLIKEDLWVRNGLIVNPEKVFFDEKIKCDTKVNCKGAIIAPGFIDVQINGEKIIVFISKVFCIRSKFPQSRLNIMSKWIS